MTRGRRSGYQETQADKRSEAGGAGTRTTTVQTRTRPMATRRSPQIAEEEDVEEEPQVYQEHNTRRAREQRG